MLNFEPCVHKRYGGPTICQPRHALALERGDSTIAIGTLATAVFILGLHERLANLAAPASDELALSMDERRLPQRIRRRSHL